VSAPRFSGSVSLMATALPFAARFDAVARAGFEGVEIQQIAEARGTDVSRAARDAGVAIALINVDMGDLAAGGPGLSGVPGREAMFRERFCEAAELASLSGAASLHLAPSRVLEGMSRTQCLDAYTANLGWAADAARGAPFTLVIEPINPNDVPGVLLDDLEAGAQLAGAAGVGLLFDAYHVAMLGLDPAEAFVRHAPLVTHVQVSDMPGRGMPGSGRIDFARLFETIATSDYRGWIGAEYAAEEVSEADCAWLAGARSAFGAPSASETQRQ
jgi:hydroxypyruvate isomerase